ELDLHDQLPGPADRRAVARGRLCEPRPQRGRRPAADLSIPALPSDLAQRAQFDLHSSPLAAMLAPKPFGEMDVMDDENAWTYWSRSDAHAMVMNIGGNPKARAGLCRVIERWISHLLGVAVSVETVPSIEDRDWRWFVGLDSEGTKIGNALWNGAAVDTGAAERVV